MSTVKTKEMCQLIVDVLFTGDQSPPATYYVGLGVGALPASDDTLADITEVTGGGYYRIPFTRAADFVASSTADSATASTAALTSMWASTAWDEADYAFLTDVASGTDGLLLAASTQPVVMTPGARADVGFDYREGS